nr:hypothetical protein [Tanacetum cinerariifolium]
RLVSKEYQKWLTKLMVYNFEIQYRPGKDNSDVDALSRRAESVKYKALSVPSVYYWDELLRDPEHDAELEPLQKKSWMKMGHALGILWRGDAFCTGIGMRKDIAMMVLECVVCQRQKYSTLALSGLLQPLELPEKVWDQVTMDFINGLPKSEGFTVILVVVDRLRNHAKAKHSLPPSNRRADRSSQ